jgi:hypothetical protein
MTTHHCKDAERLERLKAFGLTLRQAEARIRRALAHAHIADDLAVVIARSRRNVRVGEANGNHLVAIIRKGNLGDDNVWITTAICRQGQVRASRFRVSTVLFS